MAKLLILVLIIAVIYLILKKSSNKKKNHEATKETAEDMVRCSHCGVHLPKSEAIIGQAKFFCSDSHRREQSK